MDVEAAPRRSRPIASGGIDTRRTPTTNYLDDFRRDIEDFNRGELSRVGETLDENLVVHTVAEVKELRQVGEVLAAHVALKIRGHDTALEQQREYAQLIVHHRGKAVLILFFDDFAAASLDRQASLSYFARLADARSKGSDPFLISCQ